MSSILVTGGTWFIWSHTVVELLTAGHEVVIYDNLSNSDASVTTAIQEITNHRAEFIEGDLRSYEDLDRLFTEYDFDAVIHFAGLKSVGDSCADPFSYYDSNIVGTMNLLMVMDEHDVSELIFSSSATVYDSTHETAPFGEEMRTWHTTNPYGTTKFVIEQLLMDMARWKDMQIISLRYFNPVWAHPSGLLGEDPTDTPTNLLPVIMDVMEGRREVLQIFGDDYDTDDGTCVRDYIHVVDLAQAHMAALDALADGEAYRTYNVGTGVGTSVSELIQIVEQASGRSLPTESVPRRDGDVDVAVADVTKITNQLWRTAKMTVTQAVEDAIRFRNS